MKVTKLNINGVEKDISNLVVILGANNAGKTTLLKDLYAQSVSSTNRAQSSTDAIKWNNIIPNDFFQADLSEYKNLYESLEKITDQQPVIFRSRDDITKHTNADVPESIEMTFKENLNSLNPEQVEDTYSRYLKAVYFNPLWVESRFALSQQSTGQRFGPESNQYNVPSFFVNNETILNRFNNYLSSYFDLKMYFQPHRLPDMELLIGPLEVSEIDSYDPYKVKINIEAYEKWKIENGLFQLSAAFGHGIQAAADIIFRLSIDSQVYFIDEPELHLYPEVKRQLGRTIGELSSKKQFFIVSHDVDFIDGLLSDVERFDVLRINRQKKLEFYKFTGKKLQNIRSSKRNSDAVRAAFHDYAIYVEGVKDKYLYEGALNSDRLLDGISSIVVPCHGNERISEFLPISRELNIKSCVIVDFDTLKNIRRNNSAYVLHQLIDGMVDDQGIARKLKAKHMKIKELLSGIDNIWIKGVKAIDEDETRTEVFKFLDDLKSIGLFMVPFGSLESWFSPAPEDEVEDLLPKYKFSNKKTYTDLRQFIKAISDYLLKA